MQRLDDDSTTPFTPVDGASKRVKLMPWILARQAEATAPVGKPRPGNAIRSRAVRVATIQAAGAVKLS